MCSKCFTPNINNNNINNDLPYKNLYVPPIIMNNPIKQNINKSKENHNDIELEDFTNNKYSFEPSLQESWITISPMNNDEK
jgi:hypothetical protein